MAPRKKFGEWLKTSGGEAFKFCFFTLLGIGSIFSNQIAALFNQEGVPQMTLVWTLIPFLVAAFLFYRAAVHFCRAVAGFRDGYRKKIAALEKENKAQKERVRKLEADADVQNARKGIKRLCHILIGCRRNLIRSELRGLVAEREWKLIISRDDEGDKTNESSKRAAALQEELERAGFRTKPTLKSAAEYIQPEHEGTAAIVEANPAVDLLSYKDTLRDLMSLAYRWSLNASDDTRPKFEVRENGELKTDEIRFILLPPKKNEWLPNREPVTGVDIPEEEGGGT